MGDISKPPGNTQPLPENPELANLREREKMLVAKLAEHDKADANDYNRRGFNLSEIKQRTQSQLAEIRKAIAEATK